jgi:hypothetical protein
MSQPRLEIVKDEPDDLRAKLRKVIVHRDELLAKAADAQAAFDTAALTYHDARELAYRELAAEAGEAHNVAHAAAVAADWIIEDILDAEGRELAREVIATQHEHWRKFDLLVGFRTSRSARKRDCDRCASCNRTVAPCKCLRARPTRAALAKRHRRPTC